MSQGGELRDHEADLLAYIQDMRGQYPRAWWRPMDFGGSDRSHHSATLNKLVRLGVVQRQRRAGHVRPSYLYRAVAARRGGKESGR